MEGVKVRRKTVKIMKMRKRRNRRRTNETTEYKEKEEGGRDRTRKTSKHRGAVEQRLEVTKDVDVHHRLSREAERRGEEARQKTVYCVLRCVCI